MLAAGGPGVAAELPSGLPAQQTLTQADQDAIAAFAKERVALLAASQGEAQAAREALLAPLRGNVAVAFRLAYSGALMPDLARLATGADDRAAFNSLRVAGALATDAAATTIAGALQDARASVRYGGAFASRRLLEEVRANRAGAAGQGQVVRNALKEAIAAETDPGVVDGLISALEIGGDDAATKKEALLSLCAGMSAQATRFGEAQALEAERWAYAFQRAVKVAQTALLEQGRVGKPDAPFAKAAAEMCGRMLAHVVARLEGAPGEGGAGEEASALVDLASAAEGTLIFIDANLAARPTPIPQQVREAFPDAAKVRRVVERWVGPKGALAQPPYSLNVPMR